MTWSPKVPGERAQIMEFAYCSNIVLIIGKNPYILRAGEFSEEGFSKRRISRWEFFLFGIVQEGKNWLTSSYLDYEGRQDKTKYYFDNKSSKFRLYL